MRHYELVATAIRAEVTRRVGHRRNIKVSREQAKRIYDLADSVKTTMVEFVRAQYEVLDKETCLRLFNIPYIPMPVMTSDKAVLRFRSCGVGQKAKKPKENSRCQRLRKRDPRAQELWEVSHSDKKSQPSSEVNDQPSTPVTPPTSTCPKTT